MTNAESGRIYEGEYREPIETGIDRMRRVVENPIGLRKWVLEGIGESGLVSDPVANISAAELLWHLEQRSPEEIGALVSILKNGLA